MKVISPKLQKFQEKITDWLMHLESLLVRKAEKDLISSFMPQLVAIRWTLFIVCNYNQTSVNFGT